MLLITEFMDGGDLHKAINKHQISWYKRCGAFAQYCLRCLAADAVETSHRAAAACASRTWRNIVIGGQ